MGARTKARRCLCPKTPEGPGGLSSPDDFDLLSLGLLPQEEEPEEEPPEEEPQINPLHDMDSLEFLLWAEEGARAQIARKKAQQQTPEAPRNNLTQKQPPWNLTFHGGLFACSPPVTGFHEQRPDGVEDGQDHHPHVGEDGQPHVGDAQGPQHQADPFDPDGKDDVLVDDAPGTSGRS